MREIIKKYTRTKDQRSTALVSLLFFLTVILGVIIAPIQALMLTLVFIVFIVFLAIAWVIFELIAKWINKGDDY